MSDSVYEVTLKRHSTQGDYDDLVIQLYLTAHEYGLLCPVRSQVSKIG